jgi:hypothetical protein
LKNNWNFFVVVDALAEINYRNKLFSLCLRQEQNNNTLLPAPVNGGLLSASYY